MRLTDHRRKRGSLAAWKELNRRVAEDLEAGVADIKPVRIIHRFATAPTTSTDRPAPDVATVLRFGRK